MLLLPPLLVLLVRWRLPHGTARHRKPGGATA
jgi:hypothetical protein